MKIVDAMECKSCYEMFIDEAMPVNGVCPKCACTVFGRGVATIDCLCNEEDNA